MGNFCTTAPLALKLIIKIHHEIIIFNDSRVLLKSISIDFLGGYQIFQETRALMKFLPMDAQIGIENGSISIAIQEYRN